MKTLLRISLFVMMISALCSCSEPAAIAPEDVYYIKPEITPLVVSGSEAQTSTLLNAKSGRALN